MFSGKKDCIGAIILVGIVKLSRLSLGVKLAKANKKKQIFNRGETWRK